MMRRLALAALTMALLIALGVLRVLPVFAQQEDTSKVPRITLAEF